jgi:predicted RNase H-like HicB family nuclease
MKLVYPAVLYAFSDGSQGYVVEVPDLSGCVTEGDTLADAILMGIDAASGWILDEWENGRNVPPPSNLSELPKREDGIVSLLAIDMDQYAEKYGSKAIRKNLTIPAFMNTYAEANGLNFSKLLQEAITQQMLLPNHR